MRKLLFALVMTLAGILPAWSQNGTRLIAVDAVSGGRGGTSTGFFDNSSLMMNNPAGLSFLKSSQADLSFSLMAPEVHFKNNINDACGDKNLFPLGSISYARKTPGKLTYAAGIFTQGGMGADFSLNHTLYKDASLNFVPQPYHSKFAVVQGGGSLSYQLNKQLAIGATANLVYGQVEFQMPMSMPPSMLGGVINPSTGMTFGNLFGGGYESGGLGYTELVASANMNTLKALGFNGKIGLAYKPSDKFSLGINYTLPVDLTYKNGKAQMDMTYQMDNAFGKVVAGILQQYPNTPLPQAQQMAQGMFANMGIDLTRGASDQYDAEARFGLPQSIAAGLFFAPTPKLRLALDGEWINWEKAFDQMDITLTGGTNPNINRMMGTQGSISMAFPMYWENTVVIRSGAEYDATRSLTLRAGYAYGSNPVPATTVFPVFPAIVTDHLTAGISVKLPRGLVLNGAYEYAFQNDQKASANSLVADEYNNSTSSLENHIFHVSLSWLLKK